MKRKERSFENETPEGKRRKRSQTKQWFYAVKKGKTTGIYSTWEECSSQVTGYKGAEFKKFSEKKDAESFLGIEESEKTTTVPTKGKKCDGAGSVLTVYSDGACSNNGKAGAKAGVGVWFGDDHPKNFYGPLKGKRQTNQRAELTAGLKALKLAKKILAEKTEDAKTSIEVITDSAYLVNGMKSWVKSWKQNGWKREPENEDLWRALDEERTGAPVIWTHVKGHFGVHGNEQADRLAVRGMLKHRG